MNYRKERLSKLISKKLSELLAKHLDVRGVLVTVTNLELDKDLEWAKVGLGIIPKNFAEESLKKAREQASLLQHLILKQTRIRRSPKLEFYIDHGVENAATVEKRLLEDSSFEIEK